MNKLIDKSHYFKLIKINNTRRYSYHVIINNNNYNNLNINNKYYTTTNNNNSSSSGSSSSNKDITVDTRNDIEIEWSEPTTLSTKSKSKKCVLTGQDRIPKSIKDISFLNKHGLLVKLSSSNNNNNNNNNIIKNKDSSNNNSKDNSSGSDINSGDEIIREEYNDTFEVIKTKKQKQIEKELSIGSRSLDSCSDDQVEIVLEQQDNINLIKSSGKKKKKEISNLVGSDSGEHIDSNKQVKKSKKKSKLELSNNSNSIHKEEEEVSLEIDQDEINREYNLDENGDNIVIMNPGFELPDLDRIKSNLEKPLKEKVKRSSRKKSDTIEQQEVVNEIGKQVVEEQLVKSKSKSKLKELESSNSGGELNELDKVKLVSVDNLKNKKRKEKVDEYINIIDVYKEWKENVLLKSSDHILKTTIKLPNEPIKMNQYSNSHNNNNNNNNNNNSSSSNNNQNGILEQKHEWDDLIQSCNKMVFGNKEFRPLQKQVINSILHNRDTFVSLPTGGGKSLCFQIPSIVDQSGISFVVSPLLSLMQDQVHKLKLLGIPACSINSSNTTVQNRKTIAQLLDKENCNISIVYISPERLAQPEFIQILNILNSQNRIKRLIVDEAHCISEWGHDFRPAYRKISLFRENFPTIPIAAFTATAKPSVERDIKSQLMLRDPVTIASSFLRTNLIYQIRSKSSDQFKSFSDIADYIKYKQSSSCGIIYCATTSDCELLSQYLNEVNIDSHYYHGSLKNSERIEIQKAWTNKSFKVIVTTLAFGMGIDVKDVRFIIHYTMPSSIEAYYQQTGRAGRDGLKSECILYYSSNDYFKISRIIQTQSSSSSASSFMTSDELEYSQFEQLKSQQQQMHENKVELLDSINSFCRNDDICRRVQLLDYFGEESKSCKTNCDICISNTSKTGYYPLKKLQNDIQSNKDTIERVYTRNSYSTFHLKKNKNKNNRHISYDNDDE